MCKTSFAHFKLLSVESVITEKVCMRTLKLKKFEKFEKIEKALRSKKISEISGHNWQKLCFFFLKNLSSKFKSMIDWTY